MDVLGSVRHTMKVKNLRGKNNACSKIPRVYMSYVQSCFTRVRLCNPMNFSLPGSSVHRILQARILEWVAIPPSGDLLDRGFRPMSLNVSCIGRGIPYHQRHLRGHVYVNTQIHSTHQTYQGFLRHGWGVGKLKGVRSPLC